MPREKRVQHVGIGAARTKDKQNALEKLYAQEWAKLNGGHTRTGMSDECTLFYLLAGDMGQLPGFRSAYAERDVVSQRDATVAATVIQWLGSDVGSAFVRDVLAKHKAKP